MKSGATESSFYYLSQYYQFPNNVEVSRSIEILSQSNKQYKILWAHDNCDQPQLARLPELVSQIDLIVCVSKWEKEQYVKYNRAPAEKIVVIPNGVADIFNLKTPKSKTAIYFSGPHKGIAPLPKIWKQVIKNHPDAKLKVFSSHNLYGEQYEQHFKIPEHLEAIEELKSLPGVEYSPCIDREDLLPHIQDAAFFVHPNVWEETFCVSMAEAMVCGCYPITSDIGALSEISFNRGKYIPMLGTNTSVGWEPSPKFINEFAQELSRCFEFFDNQPETFYAATKELSQIAKETYDWKKIATHWEQLIQNIQGSTQQRPKYYCMPTMKYSEKYTHLALDTFFRNSILNEQDKFFLIDNDKTFSKDYKNVTVISNSSPKSFAENMNFVLKQAIMDGADFVGLNNDIAFTKNWNQTLGNSDSISIPLCNQHLQIGGIKHQMELEEFVGKENELNEIAHHITTNKQDIAPNLIKAFYCFYVPYEVSSKVGLLDEEFGLGGGEDIDYALRAEQLGIETKFNHSSYLLHFSHKTLDSETTKETDQRTEQLYFHFCKKWGKEVADRRLSLAVTQRYSV
jgi:glycosyltransferase involved in cell wall biosynthesis/GT2 family glycosyltransferase